MITKRNKETTGRTAWKDKQNFFKNSPASGMTAATTLNNFEEIKEDHIDGSVLIGGASLYCGQRFEYQL